MNNPGSQIFFFLVEIINIDFVNSLFTLCCTNRQAILNRSMNLLFDTSKVKGYSSKSQIARVLTEDWVKQNGYCPNCGNFPLMEFLNNRPVADFYCCDCDEEFELKSKMGKLGRTITDGAYSTMIERINSENNPNFFLISYTKNLEINDFLIIPKQFFTESIIIKRPKLKETARRAGWIGCNIDLSRVSDVGKVFIVKNSIIVDPKKVKEKFAKTIFLRNTTSESKGWILDILQCLDRIPKSEFRLNDVYSFEQELKTKYPNNNFVKDKIRQQLQLLRDRGLIEFTSRGHYRKINYENTNF